MDIYLINTNSVINIDNEYLDLYKKRKFKDKKQEKIHAFTYLMLDKLLTEIYKITKKEIIFINKKPYLRSKEIFFSLSHSGDYIAIAISKNECGIDIEKVKQRNYKKISDRMNFKSNSLEEFYENWTKYEAVYKLGKEPTSVKSFYSDKYVITAVSDNIDETFELYFQSI